MTSATCGSTSIGIDADPRRVYDLVADVTRMGSRSPECYRTEWLEGTESATEGARFRGHNKLGPFRWTTTCVVTTAKPGDEFTFEVVDSHGRTQTRWRYQIEPAANGSTLTESYEFLWCPMVARIAELPIPRDRQLRRGIAATVAAVKREAERRA